MLPFKPIAFHGIDTGNGVTIKAKLIKIWKSSNLICQYLGQNNVYIGISKYKRWRYAIMTLYRTIVILAENSSCLTAKVFSLASRAESIECKMKWIHFQFWHIWLLLFKHKLVSCFEQCECFNINTFVL